MRRHIITVIGLVLALNLFCQENRYSRDDATQKYYSKTDFSEVDTLGYWKFRIDTILEVDRNDTIHPIGRVHFWRTVAIDDGISQKVYNRLWTPSISFSIYQKKDLVHCKEISKRVRLGSSCVIPDVGGDFVVLGNIILLNTSVCVSCIRYNTGRDYCRPLLNKVFGEIEDIKITSIKDLRSSLRRFIDEESDPKKTKGSRKK